MLFYIPFKGKEWPAKTKCMITKLPTVSVNFGYSEKVFFLNRSVLATAEADSH